jgi:succinate-semialdehyde dehydrogenase/glutarate-semialdehyde dehydrogenase
MACGALASGNLILLKHSDLTSACAELIEEIFCVDGIKLITNLRISHQTVEFLMSTREFEMVTFTGSTEGGRKVAALAGASIKKSLLELGGSDAYIFDESCEADFSVEKAVQSRLINTGQSCIAGKRFYVHESQFEFILQKFAAHLRSKKQENPLFENADLGPLAHDRFVEKLEKQIDEAIVIGAKWIQTHSGIREHGFSKAGILNFSNDLRAFEQEELFGPVALFYSYSKLDDVIDALNAGPFALGAGLFTQSKSSAQKVAADLKVGTFVVNDFVKSDVRVPFGGMRESGYGAELGAVGVNEFVIWRSININGNF